MAMRIKRTCCDRCADGQYESMLVEIYQTPTGPSERHDYCCNACGHREGEPLWDEGENCPECHEGHLELQSKIQGITRNGPIEHYYYRCSSCAAVFQPDEPYEGKKEMSTNIETLNLLYSRQGIQLIMVQLDRNQKPWPVKLHEDCPPVEVNDYVVISTDGYSIARVCAVGEEVDQLALNLSREYIWAIQRVDIERAKETELKEKRLIHAIVSAEAQAKAKAVFNELPIDVQALIGGPVIDEDARDAE